MYLWFYLHNDNGQLSVSDALTMRTVDEGEVPETQPVELSIAAAQELMDQLWQVGIRPSEGSGSAGSLKATQEHLEDMRKIAFHQLQIK